MKGQIEWWTATALLVLLATKEASVVNCEEISEGDKFLDDSGNEEKLSDLEGSETFHRNFASPFHVYFPKISFFSSGCEESRYRTFDGSCNNLYNPTWGMANTTYGRLLPPRYGNGLNSPPNSVTGSELPLSRLVSYTLFPDNDVDDPIWTLVAMQYGQIITHDMSLAAGNSQSSSHATQCCTNDGQVIEQMLSRDSCYPIITPYDDPVYSKANIRCLNFVRSATDLDNGYSNQFSFRPAEQLNDVTHFLDLSLVYGSSDQLANSLRAGVGGRMVVDIRRNREWPPSAANKSATCDITSPNEVCYQAGDVRVNQNTQLTVLQIILLREHNRIADALARINPHWTDETIFQEARRIAIAEHQHISYYEWLPIFLGTSSTYGNNILYDTTDYVNDYDPDVNPNVLNEHTTAAFRYFHSLIAGFLDLVKEDRSSNAALRLSTYMNKPSVIEENDNMADLTRGLSFQSEKASDQFFDAEITRYLFRNGRPLGSDLRATDIQRDRDHGLASYNDVREYCGLPRAIDFDDFTDYISFENVMKLASLYASPDDVDLAVGGALETHVQGLTGPTYLCIFIKQFYQTRVGDRYWFESGDHKLAFTIEQLNEIRKSSISRLLCDNGDDIVNMQKQGFKKVDSSNPIMSCDNIPSVNLLLWKDFAPELENHEKSTFPFFKR
ncbi:hypothetical protein QLX08_002738 [Tetragonisca angustula]|uniref:Peroxidase n=1 Tax=Tetragonisca angustula TaxID=166442 RepID=A0AAW1A9N0_9HYME